MDISCLELFCGTKSFTKILKKHGARETATLDINPIFKPDILTDILKYVNSGLHYSLIWASPPCKRFSLMSAKHYWKKVNGEHVPKHERTLESLKLIDKTIQIIDKDRPAYWFIENPRGILRFVIDPIFKRYGIKDYARHTVTYCQYGERRMKPTDIWTNCTAWNPRPPCKIGDPCHERVTAKNNGRSGTIGLPTDIHRAIVPKELCEEIVKAVESDLIESA